jgi:hypothetical protein
MKILYNTGVSEIRVLILTSGRTRQFMKLFSITFLRKSITNGFKIWNKLAIKAPMSVRNGALSKNL